MLARFRGSIATCVQGEFLTMVSEGVVATPVLAVRVAELGLRLDARGTGLHLAAPPGHAKFLQPQTAESCESPAVFGGLVLRVRNGPPPEAKDSLAPLYLSENWELWLDEAGRYVFAARRESPPRRVVVDAGFTAGEVLGDFSSFDGEGLYPHQRLEIRLFANWLANFGDVILHAAGVAVGGRGYCFAGTGGVGKSTLAAALASDTTITVLGEDQVILRCLEDRFWIYGTPWHENPAMCSPLGVPLEKLFFLERTGEDGMAVCAPVDGVVRLLQTAFIPYYRAEAVSAILDRLALLARSVPFYTLSYRLGADVWGLIREAGTLRQRARCDGLKET